jgi:uncharacterized membrane protein (DUF2068 family)
MSSRVFGDNSTLRLIAAFKLLKGLGLLAVGIGVLHYLHRDIALEVERWVDVFQIDPDNRYVQPLLTHISNLDEKGLRTVSIGTFFYAAVLLTEGTGLWLRKRWAEYFTILTTASFVPLEVYEIYRKVTAPRVTLLLVNLAIVAYLIFDLRSHPKEERESAGVTVLRH